MKNNELLEKLVVSSMIICINKCLKEYVIDNFFEEKINNPYEHALNDYHTRTIENLIKLFTVEFQKSACATNNHYTYLINPFESIKNIDSKAEMIPKSFFIPEKIERINYPFCINESKNYTSNILDLFKRFKEELSTLTDVSVDLLLMLIEKYFTYIPYSPKLELLNISLYHYAKFASAFTGCFFNISLKNKEFKNNLCDNQENALINSKDNFFLLVFGDLSGIQNFIYTISSTGALRSLRGRSFYLEMVTEKTVNDLINGMELSTANIIYTGGGGFALLSYNSAEAKEFIDKTKKALNRWLWEEFEGKLYYNIEYQECSFNDFLTTEDTFNKLSKKIEESKRKKFDFMLDAILHRPVLPMQLTDSCAVCHTDNRDINKTIKDITSGVCDPCYQAYHIAEHIKDEKMKYIYETKEQDYDFSISGTLFKFSKKPSINSDAFHFIINSWKTEDWKAENNKIINGRQLLVANYTSGCKELEDLAERSIGKQLIAALRMDVDNLGEMFSKKIIEKHRNILNIASISRFLTLFFKYYLNHICSGEYGIEQTQISSDNSIKKRNVDIIYSGGDDLFILGAWNETAELAFDIHSAFDRFTGHNKNITISGGLTLHKHDYPVYQIANMSKKAEQEAKNNETDNIKKNSICLFFNEGWKIKEKHLHNKMKEKTKIGEEIAPFIIQAIDWENAKKEIIFYTRLLNNIDWSSAPHGFLNKLFSLIAIWHKDGVFCLPILYYVVSKSRKYLDVNNASEILININTENMAKLLIPLTWVSYLQR